MKIAVLSLTRDRLDYTIHCFNRLRKCAGVDYDHYVLDNGSTDGTQDWLRSYEYPSHWVDLGSDNLGVSKGMNRLLGQAGDGYDVVVKFDNDCELTQPNTLRDCCEIALAGDAIVSPRILGLNSPPGSDGEFLVGDEPVLNVGQIGGIFMAVPAWVFTQFRYDETNPVWGMDDVQICQWMRSQGRQVGYVKRLEANHYETTVGQEQRYPHYFLRKHAEFNA